MQEVFMQFDKFNALSEKLSSERRASVNEVDPDTVYHIRSEYGQRYAQTPKTSREIVLELCDEFPEVNVPEVLRERMSHSRE
ncbi:hypothetical protein ACFL08_03825 [Patescibacteria group bacterium]